MKLTNKEKLSLSIAVWLAEDLYDHNPDPNHVSATGLLKPIRQIALADKIPPEEVEFDIVDLIPTSMGTALHEGIERSWVNSYERSMHKMGYPKSLIERILVNPTPEDLAKAKNPITVYMEQRVTKEIAGRKVSGKYDFVGQGILEDNKSTGTYKYIKCLPELDLLKNIDVITPESIMSYCPSLFEFIMQGSIYKWLDPKKITSEFMVIQFIFTDWSKLMSMIQEKSGYPKFRVQKVKLPLLDPKITEKWIRTKLNLIESLINVPQEKLPECTNYDLWRGDSVFKYYKNPEKRARSTKNFDNYAEANDRYIKDGSVGVIVDVKGQVKRCFYCNVFDICHQKDDYILDGTLVV